MATKVKMVVDIRGVQNKEMEISRCLKELKGNRIEKIELDDKGNLAIFYNLAKTKSSIRYTVKQVSKKKYKTLDEFLETSSFYYQSGNGHTVFGTPKLEEKWVIDVENVWLVFFKC